MTLLSDFSAKLQDLQRQQQLQDKQHWQQTLQLRQQLQDRDNNASQLQHQLSQIQEEVQGGSHVQLHLTLADQTVYIMHTSSIHKPVRASVCAAPAYIMHTFKIWI